MNAKNEENSAAPDPKWRWQFGVAVVLLIAFAALTVAMMLLAQGADTVWQRRVYLFGSTEALVFTAIGWLFGREVNRSAVESAKSDAVVARTELHDARTEASRMTAEYNEAAKAVAEERVKGRAIKAVIHNSRSARVQAREPRDVADISDGPAAESTLLDIVKMVDELYGGQP